MLNFAFAGSPLDRSSHLRQHTDKLSECASSPRAAFIKVNADQVKLAGSALDLRRPDQTADAVFLGIDHQDVPWFALAVTETENMMSLRAIMMEDRLDRGHLAILAQARSLLSWHGSHGYCANCGSATTPADGGYRRHCGACGTDHFPRTDPVVIMAVTGKDGILLGRQKAWPEGMYSALAGFLEPGETMEEAVRREVKEESGIEAGAVRYVASQPWPFPSSLMIGAVAEATGGSLKVDESELETARWFSREEVRQMLLGKHAGGLYASRPQAIAWHVVKAALRQVKSG
jgi:NADH pyrophosphatase NudC (nudix superfamily)